MESLEAEDKTYEKHSQKQYLTLKGPVPYIYGTHQCG